jgi:O-antigen ligase
LGLACAVAIVIIWTLLFPEWSFFKRILVYPVIAVLAVALVGSGARTANVAAVVCILLGTFLCRKLWADLLAVASLAIVALPFVWIPQASYEYLASLAHPPQAMDTRKDLMALGVKLFGEHPFLGVGIQGFRFLSPNPLTYNFPHNILLELGSELGVFASLAYLGIAVFSFLQIFREIRRRSGTSRNVAVTVLMLMILLSLEAMVSGDINDLRLMWFVLGLPFVLRLLREQENGELEISTFEVSPKDVELEPEFVVQS